MPKAKGKTGTSALVAITVNQNAGITKTKKKTIKGNEFMPPVVVTVANRTPRPARNANVAFTTAPRYFRDPVYGPSDDGYGASWMNVQIGPAQANPANYGKKPDVDTPHNMRWLKDNEPAHGWIAGHLLNDNLGGPGIAKNLTPLTTAGNKNHLTGCETIIKNSIDRADSYSTDKNQIYWYGVEYSVVVSDDAWPNMPVFVATHLTVNAKVIRQHRVTKIIDDAPAVGTPTSIYFAPIVSLRIDNPGYI